MTRVNCEINIQTIKGKDDMAKRRGLLITSIISKLCEKIKLIIRNTEI